VTDEAPLPKEEEGPEEPGDEAPETFRPLIDGTDASAPGHVRARELQALGRSLATLGLTILCAVVALLGSARRAPEPPPPTELDAVGLAASGWFPSIALSASAAPEEEEDAPDQAPTCGIPERGFGPYGKWQTLPLGRMLVPSPAPQESYDLLLHFHGGEAVRRVVAPARLDEVSSVPLVIAAVDAGIGSQAYVEAFAGAQPLEELLGTVGAALAPARLRYLIVSSWSAGYGAVREILKEHPTTPNAVVLLDSVHTAYKGDGKSLVTEALAPFLSYAQRARAEEAVMVLTHSEIRPPGYASTSEVASYFVEKLGGRREYAGLAPAAGVEFKTRFDDGLLHIRGYSGTSKESHCAHLSLLADILKKDVLPALPE
jgi:hypothetical protein